MTAPFKISTAGVRYKKGDAEIRVKITDSAYNALMLVPFSWVSNMGYEKETETGYEKAVKVAGFPGLEKWNTESKDGELTLVANKRYIVELEGNDIGDPKVLHHARRVDVAQQAPRAVAVENIRRLRPKRDRRSLRLLADRAQRVGWKWCHWTCAATRPPISAPSRSACRQCRPPHTRALPISAEQLDQVAVAAARS